MNFTVGDQPTALREKPSPDATMVRPLGPNTDLGEGKPSDDKLWIQVDLGPDPEDKGWVLKADCVAADARPEMASDGFVQKCVLTDWAFNASDTIPPWVVSSDFLIARAIIETNITNAGPLITGSDGVGPLQVTSAEWTEFLTSGDKLAAGFSAADRDDPIRQVDGAAYRMHNDAKKIGGLRAASVQATAEDPYVPSYLEVFLAYLTNSPAAAVAIVNAQAAGQKAPVDQILKGTLSPDQITALLAARGKFFGQPNAKPLDIFVADTEKVLNDALAAAFEAIKKNMPEAITPVTQGQAPWLDMAKQEEKDKVAEPNPRILTYFDATDLTPRPTSTKTPWCGAFAAFCMSKSGNPTAAASIPKGSAAAASWKTFGAAISKDVSTIPPGAVVVLSPTGTTGGTGHVGFFVKATNGGKSVVLLGGNQSNAVDEMAVSVGKIAAVRWLDLASDGPVAGGGTSVQPAVDGLKLPKDVLPQNRQFADMIVQAFAAAGFGKIQQVAAVANAIGESGLDPNQHTMPEDSVGLFQLRRLKGLGGKHSVPELQDPKFNIQVIIAEAKRFPTFANAKSLEDAVTQFVVHVERPKNPQQDIAKRLAIAQSLTA